MILNSNNFIFWKTDLDIRRAGEKITAKRGLDSEDEPTPNSERLAKSVAFRSRVQDFFKILTTLK
jgi:hypothetical protein